MRTITLLLLSGLGLLALRNAPGIAPAELQLGPLTFQLVAESRPVLKRPPAPSVAPEAIDGLFDLGSGAVHPRCLIVPLPAPGGHMAPQRFEIRVLGGSGAPLGLRTRSRSVGLPLS